MALHPPTKKASHGLAEPSAKGHAPAAPTPLVASPSELGPAETMAAVPAPRAPALPLFLGGSPPPDAPRPLHLQHGASGLGAARPAGPGQGLPSAVRARFEPFFGDLSRVRVSAEQPAVAAEGARAITEGQHIRFAPGQLDAGSRSGGRLLAHELAHTVQQSLGEAAPQAAGWGDDQHEREANAAADAVMNGAPLPRLSPVRAGASQHDDTKKKDEDDAAPVDTTAVAAALAAKGLQLDDDALRSLARQSPHGVTLVAQDRLFLSFGTGTQLSLLRLPGFSVVPAAPLAPGVESYIFQVGKGRAILISSTSGPSVLLDAGAGTSRGNSAQVGRLVSAMRSLLGVGLASAPSWVSVSHTDADHTNAINPILQLSGMNATSVEVSRQQIRGRLGAADWTAADIRLQPGQQLVEVDVVGGEAFSRRFMGNFELVQLRAQSAHAAMDSPTAARYDRNATSPVTVEIDLLTGARKIYTADAPGATFSEVIDMVGEAAFLRLAGGAGRNLKVVEIPHHGGKVAGRADVGGMLRFLQLAYEASDGSLRLITQTSQRFSGRASASINFLDNVGVPVERIFAESTTGPGSELVRSTGGRLEQMEIDPGQVRRVLEVAQANETVLGEAYRRLHELKSMRETNEPIRQALQEGRAIPAMASSLNEIATSLDRAEQELRPKLGAVWDAMRADAGSEGMRSSTPTAATSAATTQLRAHLEATSESHQRTRNAVATHLEGLNAYERLFQNVFRMTKALMDERYEELNQARVEYEKLLAYAEAFLGARVVDEHVRGAWAAVRAEWTGERLKEMASRLGGYATVHREMMTQYRAELQQSIGRQMQLNELIARASHGGRMAYRADGTAYMPARTRAGAGFMIGIEVLRIAGELWTMWEEAEKAREAARAQNQRMGLETVRFWDRLRCRPKLALVSRGWWSGKFGVVSDGLSAKDIWDVVAGKYAGEAPEYEMVVVEDVPDADLQFLVGRLMLELRTLGDFVAWNGSNPSGGPTFEKFGDVWAVRLWSREEHRYLYFRREVIQKPLASLIPLLEAAQQREMSAEIVGSKEHVQTVDDTALIFGQDRYVYVFNERGRLEEVDFDAVQPKFIRRGLGVIDGNEFEVVKAVDLPTYRRLSAYYLRETTGTWIGQGGGGETYRMHPNREGIGYVKKGKLVSTVGTVTHETAARAAALPGAVRSQQ
jgi:hypothetical protein